MANGADPDLDLHCLTRQGISGFSRTRVNSFKSLVTIANVSPHSPPRQLFDENRAKALGQLMAGI